MPNHITTKIKYPKKHHKEITEKVRGTVPLNDGKIREFDFNSLIPTPKYIFQGDLGKAEEEKYGKENCWYEWNVKNWGTKWNAYDIVIKPGEIQFDTAWSLPRPIIKELSALFPEIEFEILFADEDIGSNLGHFKVKNMETETVEEYDYHDDKEKAVRFACLVKGMDYDQYIKDIEEDQ